MKLTKSAIDTMVFEGRHPKAKDIRWDDELPGFGVRVFASGAKTFVLDYRVDGRKRLFTIGRYGVLTLFLARQQAIVRKGEILQGGDPLGNRQKAQRGECVKDLAKMFLERHATRKKSADIMRYRIETFILPAWGNLKVSAIKRSDVARLHHEIAQPIEVQKERTVKDAKGSETRETYKVTLSRKVTANRVVTLVGSMWSRGKIWGFIEESAPNPTAGIEKFPEKKRDRFVTRDEMPAVIQAIEAEENVFIRALIWMYLLTGMRKNELRTLQWRQINLARAEIVLEETKGGRPLYMPLSGPALQVLSHVPRLSGNPYVFCGHIGGRCLVNVSKPWDRIRTAAGIGDVTLHDLRRTVGSWLAMSGQSLPMIGRVLNHSNSSSTQIYARFHIDPVAAALEAHAGELEAARFPTKRAHLVGPD